MVPSKSLVLSIGIVFLLGPSATLAQDADLGPRPVPERLMHRLSEGLGSLAELEDGPGGRHVRARLDRPEQDLAVLRRIVEKRVPARRWQAPLPEVLTWLGEVGGFGIAVSDGLKKKVADRPIELSPKGSSWVGAVDRARTASGTKLAWDIVDGSVHFMTRAEFASRRAARRDEILRLANDVAGADAELLGDRHLLVTFGAKETAEAERLRQKLREQTITLNFEDTPLKEALSFLTDLTEWPFEASPAVEGMHDELVTLQLTDIPLEHALTLMIDNAAEELEWVVRGSEIRVRTVAEGEAVGDGERSFLLIDISDLLRSTPEILPRGFKAPGRSGKQR